jgi:hypothetical protein
MRDERGVPGRRVFIFTTKVVRNVRDTKRSVVKSEKYFLKH